MHAILLHPDTHPTLLAMLKSYVRVFGEMKMLFASSVKYDGAFLEAVLVTDEDEIKRRVSIPIAHVLAVADVASEAGKKSVLGFQL